MKRISWPDFIRIYFIQGALVTDIVNKMVKKDANSLKPDRSMFLYSGHDVTLVNVMRALRIIDQTSGKPDYGATLAFELHHDVSKSSTIKVYWNHSQILKFFDLFQCLIFCSTDILLRQ